MDRTTAIAVIVAATGAFIVLYMVLFAETQSTIGKDVGRCYDSSTQVRFEACLCRLADEHGCRTAMKAVPSVHHKFVLPCCGNDANEMPAEAQD